MADTYVVTNITPRTRTSPGGLFTSVQAVAFTTKPSEIAGVVDIPSSAFTPTEVDRVVRAQAALLEAVKSL